MSANFLRLCQRDKVSFGISAHDYLSLPTHNIRTLVKNQLVARLKAPDRPKLALFVSKLHR